MLKFVWRLNLAGLLLCVLACAASHPACQLANSLLTIFHFAFAYTSLFDITIIR